MEDFFKQFRENLKRRPEPDFEERDWKDMQKRLNRTGRKQPIGFAWWWLAIPALLLLMGSNVLFYKKMQHANQRIALLETGKDSIFRTQMVYIRDTIYQIRIQHHYIQRPTSILSERTTFAATHQQQPAPANQFRLLKNTDTLVYSVQDTLVAKNKTIPESVRPLPTIVFGPFEPVIPVLPAVHVAPLQAHHKKTFRQLIYPVRPKAFQLGIAGGWAALFDKDLAGRKGYSAAAEANIGFSPNLSIWVNVAYLNVRFETAQMDEAKGVPVVSPPSDAFTFVKAEVPQPSFQYAIGMKYLFRPNHRLKPFVGAGYSAISLLPYEVIYEFKDESLGIEWNYDKEIARHTLLNNFLLLRAGLEYKISRRWNGQIQANYRTNVGETGFYTPQMFGLQGGFYYCF